ncbi:MAG: zinc-ribbon domain-containing protein, partial [Myxococcaceae bacterium]|nr:zinc-ribbon domain-containing protein [Myxococcaceae bacterium]
MKATCPSCNAHLNIDDKKIPAGGARIKCPTCQNIFPVKPGGASSAVPLPGAAAAQPPPPPPASGAVPLPGAAQSTPKDTDWEDAPTRMQPAFIPPEAVPGATTSRAPPSNVNDAQTRKPAPSYKPPSVGSGGAVPLPGITASQPQSQQWEEESTRVADIPIPSAAYKPVPAAPRAPAPSAHVDFSSFEATAGNAVPLPGARAPHVEISAPTQRIPAQRPPTGAVPLPGSYEATQAHAVPAPSSYEPTHAGAVPLPGAFDLAGAATHVGPPSRGAVPLPGAFDSSGAATQVHRPPGGAVPLPGAFDPAGAATHVGPPSRGAVPLPGAFDSSGAATQVHRPSGGAVPLPGHSDFNNRTQLVPPPSTTAVPLPGSGYDLPTTQQPAFGGHDAFAESVPLPGDTSAHTASTAQNPSYQPPPEAFSFDSEPTSGASPGFGDVPEASDADFGEVPEAPPAYAAPSYAAPSADFDLPPPPEAPPTSTSGGFDFADLPSPAGQATDPGGFELDTSRPPGDDLPSPAGTGASSGGAYDFAPMPAASNPPAPSFDPVNPSASFGEVDLGGGDSLEFDPTSKPPPDDLEADLSAPLPPPKAAAPADGLEMLSFIDDTAKEAGVKDSPAMRRYHIKRRSGKVFGPFEEAVVVKMLEDGQLLGNEEVSLDSESWQPIGAEAAFQGAIAKLMEQPARAPAAQTGGPPPSTGGAPGVSVPSNRPPPPSMERLKQLYEGRMAAVAVVQGKDPVPFKKRIPLIVAGVLVLGIVGAGAWSSTTRYGLFGLKVLFPARVAQNTTEFATLNEAKKALLADTFKGYKSARENGEKLLRSKPYPEARAVWMQSVYYLARRYSAATPADLSTAEAEQENILLLGEKHVEVVKALAHAAINAKDNDKALALVAAARARQENENDLELLFLKAEAQALKGQVPQAMTDLKAVLEKDKKSAKAMHALGLLHLKQKEVDLAAGRFDEALQASPEHVSSAVELAAIEVIERKNAAKGVELIDAALKDENKVNLAPAELGRALALKAQIAADARKIDEAVESFEAALKADPANVFAKGTYGALLVERHDYAKATPMLKDAVDKSPQNLAYIESYLNSLIGLGKMDEATKMMQTASGRFPGNARIAFLSGRVEDGMDRTKQAEESYKRAISADPTMVEANIALAGLYLRLHRFAEAKPQLEEGLTKAPENALVHVGLGELALAENDVERAQAELNKAVELNPNLPGAFLGLSRTAQAKGKPDIAQKQAEKALALDPKIHDGRLQLGTALWKLGKLDEAIAELNQAKEDDPRSVNIPITLGAVALEKGDL